MNRISSFACAVLLAVTMAACTASPALLDAGPDAGDAISQLDAGDTAMDAGGLVCGGWAEEGEPCEVWPAESLCAEGLHCFNPYYDEGWGCIGYCRKDGDECTTSRDCCHKGSDPSCGFDFTCIGGHCGPSY